MSDSTMASQLLLRWVPVVDARGRTQMQARWLDTSLQVRPRVVDAA